MSEEELVLDEYVQNLVDEMFSNGFKLGYSIAERDTEFKLSIQYDDWIKATTDKLMLHGETIPELNLKNVNNYIISC